MFRHIKRYTPHICKYHVCVNIFNSAIQKQIPSCNICLILVAYAVLSDPTSSSCLLDWFPTATLKGWLQTTETHGLPVLKARRPESRCCQAVLPLRPGEDVSRESSWVWWFPGDPQHALCCSRQTPPSAVCRMRLSPWLSAFLLTVIFL